MRPFLVTGVAIVTIGCAVLALAPVQAQAAGSNGAQGSIEHRCGVQWRQSRAQHLPLPTGVTTWSQYYSWCAKRVKAGQAP